MAEKTEKKKSAKKNTGETWDVVIKCPSVIVREGVVISLSPRTVFLNAKRSGSSLRQKLTVPRGKIIFVEGNLSEGDEVKITYMSDLAQIGRKMTRVQLNDTADKETGMVKGVNEKGVLILINSEYAEMVTSKDSKVDAPAGTTTKKKKSK